MNSEERKEQRRKERELLSLLYANYNPVYHDAFVHMYQMYIEAQSQLRYLKNRGIINVEMPQK